MIENTALEGGQGLARAVRIGAAIEVADGVGQRGAGGFEVTLHAHVEFERGREALRIHDRFSDILGFRAGLLGGADVIFAGAVAALAIDSFR